MNFFFLALAALTPVLSVWAAPVWSDGAREAYHKRRFVELELMMHQEENPRLARWIRYQSEDLSGCRALHAGVGGISALLRCVRFINREGEMNLTSPGTAGIISDINTICGKIIARDGNLETAIKSGVFKSRRSAWTPCVEAAWEAVYLAAYAGFEADPVRILALMRRAQAALPGEFKWKRRTLEYVNRSSLAGSGKIGL